MADREALEMLGRGAEVETALERERREKRSVLFPIAIDDAGFSSNEAWAVDIRFAI